MGMLPPKKVSDPHGSVPRHGPTPSCHKCDRLRAGPGASFKHSCSQGGKAQGRVVGGRPGGGVPHTLLQGWKCPRPPQLPAPWPFLPSFLHAGETRSPGPSLAHGTLPNIAVSSYFVPGPALRVGTMLPAAEVSGPRRAGSRHLVRAPLSREKQRLALSADQQWELPRAPGGKADQRQEAAGEAGLEDQRRGCSPSRTCCGDPAKPSGRRPPRPRARPAGTPPHTRGAVPAQDPSDPDAFGEPARLCGLAGSGSGSDLTLILGFLICKKRVMLRQPLTPVRSDPRRSSDQ